MSIQFIIAQIAGLIVLVSDTIGIQFKKKENIIITKIISSIFFTMQYILLNAITAAIVCSIEIIRNIWIHFRDKKKQDDVGNKKKSDFIILLFVVIVVILGFNTYQNIFSLIPIFSFLLESFMLWQQKTKVIRWFTFLICTIWLIYNIYVGAYVTVINNVIVLGSTIIAIIRHDVKKSVNT